MEWQATWGNPVDAYLQHFQGLIGDQRTGVTLRETVRGIIVAGSLVCQKIVQSSPILALEPWWLVTDWPVTGPARARRIFQGFLYELGITLEWPEVQLLARLGGWSQRPDRPPGKIVITRGLRRLMEAMTTQAFLDRYIAEHGALPPRIAALMGLPPSEE